LTHSFDVLSCFTYFVQSDNVRKFAQSAFSENSVIHSDGYRSYIPALKDFSHGHKTYDPSSGLLHWLHIMVGNAKAFILGTYHGLPKDNLQSDLDEFVSVSPATPLALHCSITLSLLSLFLPGCAKGISILGYM